MTRPYKIAFSRIGRSLARDARKSSKTTACDGFPYTITTRPDWPFRWKRNLIRNASTHYIVSLDGSVPRAWYLNGLRFIGYAGPRESVPARDRVEPVKCAGFRLRWNQSAKGMLCRRFANIAFAKAPLLKRKKGTRKSEKHSMSFEKPQRTILADRLSVFAQNARDEAEKLEPGRERKALLEKARKAEAASELEAWTNSSGSQGSQIKDHHLRGKEKGAVTRAFISGMLHDLNHSTTRAARPPSAAATAQTENQSDGQLREDYPRR